MALDYYSNGSRTLGTRKTHYPTFGLEVSSNGHERHFDLEAEVETAPPDELAGGNVELVVGCLDDRVVFAYQQRVSAWSYATGKRLWSATLPAPVGHTEKGALHVSCTSAPVKQGKVSIAHAGGKTVFDGLDGSAKTGH